MKSEEISERGSKAVINLRAHLISFRCQRLECQQKVQSIFASLFLFFLPACLSFCLSVCLSVCISVSLPVMLTVLTEIKTDRRTHTHRRGFRNQHRHRQGPYTDKGFVDILATTHQSLHFRLKFLGNDILSQKLHYCTIVFFTRHTARSFSDVVIDSKAHYKV